MLNKSKRKRIKNLELFNKKIVFFIFLVYLDDHNFYEQQIDGIFEESLRPYSPPFLFNN